jgi:hypothetical protein
MIQVGIYVAAFQQHLKKSALYGRIKQLALSTILSLDGQQNS